MAEQSTHSLNMAGIWWMPENNEDRKLGTLEWTPYKGCILTLINESYEFKWGKSLGIILGMNCEQKPVTLVGCRYVGNGKSIFSNNASSFGHRVAVESVLVGIMYREESDLTLTDLYAGYAGLDEYVIEDYYDNVSFKKRSVSFSFPNYETAKIDEIEVGLFVSPSVSKGLILNHQLHISFPQNNAYQSEGENYNLVHEILPAFLSAMMGHQTFLASLSSFVGNAPVEVFDGHHPRMSWNGETSNLDPLVLGSKENLDLWPEILPEWINNFRAIVHLCRAYVKLMVESKDGFFDRNNLVHIFFGLERYYRSEHGVNRVSMSRVLEQILLKIKCYFEEVEEYIKVANSININCLSYARQVLVHSNEGNPDFTLAYHQLIFITRSVLLMEMKYPVANVRQDTQHWQLWQFFRKRSKDNAR